MIGWSVKKNFLAHRWPSKIKTERNNRGCYGNTCCTILFLVVWALYGHSIGIWLLERIYRHFTSKGLNSWCNSTGRKWDLYTFEIITAMVCNWVLKCGWACVHRWRWCASQWYPMISTYILPPTNLTRKYSHHMCFCCISRTQHKSTNINFSAGALLYKVSKSYPSCPITEVISFRISCFWLSFQDSSTTSGRACISLDVQTSRACSKELGWREPAFDVLVDCGFWPTVVSNILRVTKSRLIICTEISCEVWPSVVWPPKFKEPERINWSKI